MDSTARQKAVCHSYYVVFGMLGIGMLPPLVKSIEEAFGFTHTQMGLFLDKYLKD